MPDSKVMYAVVHIGGQQFQGQRRRRDSRRQGRRRRGQVISFEPLACAPPTVLLTPMSPRMPRSRPGSTEHLLGKKIKVFTYKPKSTFKKTKGHRSRLTKLAIESITLKKQKEN